MGCRFQLYGYDLESEFSQFQDWLRSFPLYKGRANAEDFEEDEEERLMGKYKVCVVSPTGCLLVLEYFVVVGVV